MSKIKKVKIKNFLGIKEVEFDAGKLNIIQGSMGSGKTSIIEAIEKACSNNDRRVDIIHDDEKKAEILIELDDDLEIDRRITEKGNYVNVRKDGEKIDNELDDGVGPQTFLNSLFGKYSFNPIDFLNEDDDKQKQILLQSININVSEDDVRDWLGDMLDKIENTDIELNDIDWNQHGLEIIDELEDEFYEERRIKNKERKKLKTKYQNEMEKIPDNFDPDEYRNKSLKEEYKKLQKVQKRNNKIDKAKNAIDKIDTKINDYERDKKEIEQNTQNEVEKIEMKIKRLKEQINELKNEAKNKKQKIDDNIDDLQNRKKKMKAFLEKYNKIDTSELEQEIEQFEDKKELVRAYDNALDDKQQYKTIYTQWKALDNIIDILRNKPQELLSEADLPIDNLKIEDGEAMVNDVPIQNLSSGEKIKISTEIAKATAGDLQVICVDGIERLDAETREKFYEEIKDDEFQYFITQATPGNLKIEKK